MHQCYLFFRANRVQPLWEGLGWPFLSRLPVSTVPGCPPQILPGCLQLLGGWDPVELLHPPEADGWSDRLWPGVAGHRNLGRGLLRGGPGFDSLPSRQ